LIIFFAVIVIPSTLYYCIGVQDLHFCYTWNKREQEKRKEEEKKNIPPNGRLEFVIDLDNKTKISQL
jgi:hypothetical protein